MRSALRTAVWLLAGCVLFPSLAEAQRVIFPTQPAQPYSAQPTFLGTQPTAQAGSVYTTPFNYSAPGATIPATPQPALPAAAPAVRAWDPYADPAAAAQPVIANPYAANPYGAPVDPYQSPFGSVPGYIQNGYNEAVRLLQALRAQYSWLPASNGPNDFDINTMELTAAFGIPIGQIQQPLIIAPHFNFNWWAGPQSGSPLLPPRDLPARVYDAFLETTWRPQITPMFGADLSVSVGVYSDFSFYNKNSLRVTGRGLGVMTLTPTTQLALGVWYINRDSIKLLPAGGVIYRPHADTTFELLFPNPRITQRVSSYGGRDIYVYTAGEYGGGQWTVSHADGSHDVVNYNDMRLYLGTEMIANNRFRANIEVGYVFNREILYRDQTPTVYPGDTGMLRLGVQY